MRYSVRHSILAETRAVTLVIFGVVLVTTFVSFRPLSKVCRIDFSSTQHGITCAIIPPSPPVLTPQVISGSNLIPWQCGSWFLSGANVPWQNGGFGADFGTVEEWGQHTYSHTDAEQMFVTLQANGANSVRWWVFADGRGAPEFDSNSGGRVNGLDSNFLPSMEDAIRLASKYNIYLVFNLWSFDMLFDDSTAGEKGEHAGGHRDLIVDANIRQSFINNALLSILQHPISGTRYTIGTHPNVIAWDIINEPEWGITESGAVNSNISQPVSLVEMRRFVAEVSAAIHRNSNQLVTLGSASMKWNSDGALGAVGNWWSDAALTPFASDGNLDFYQIHYYGWMNGDETTWSYSPLFNTFTATGFDKPTIVGEFPVNASGTGHTLGEILEGVYDNGYAGAWAWSYEGVDSNGSWTDGEGFYNTFNIAHSAQIRVMRCIYLPIALIGPGRSTGQPKGQS